MTMCREGIRLAAGCSASFERRALFDWCNGREAVKRLQGSACSRLLCRCSSHHDCACHSVHKFKYFRTNTGEIADHMCVLNLCFSCPRLATQPAAVLRCAALPIQQYTYTTTMQRKAAGWRLPDITPTDTRFPVCASTI